MGLPCEQERADEEGARELRASAEAGDLDAMVELGTWFWETDPAEAIRWFTRPAEEGKTFAEYALGCFFYRGEGVEKDEVRGFRWFRRAAAKGDTAASFALALAYLEGKGAPKSLARSAEWHRKAAEQGHRDAAFNLAQMYFNGDGVPEDHVLAYAWWDIAAGQGEEWSAERLRVIHEQLPPAKLAKLQELAFRWQLENFETPELS